MKALIRSIGPRWSCGRLTRKARAREEPVTLQTDDQGIAHARLVPGKYVAVASAIGYESVEVAFESSEEGGSVTLPLTAASGFDAEVTDDQGNPIPVKATIYSIDGDHPRFWPQQHTDLCPKLRLLGARSIALSTRPRQV